VIDHQVGTWTLQQKLLMNGTGHYQVLKEEVLVGGLVKVPVADLMAEVLRFEIAAGYAVLGV